jgi:tetratricopeptide (TPR) repeat protein
MNFCFDVNFAHPLCPKVVELYEVLPMPSGDLTGKSLLLAATAQRMQRPVDHWLQSLQLMGERPAQIEKSLWSMAQWIYAQSLFERKRYSEAANLLDRLLPEFKSRPSFHQQRAWAQFFSAQYDRALGSIISAESPLIDSAPFVRKYLLRALVERETCHYDKALATIQAGIKALPEWKYTAADSPWVKECSKRKGKAALCSQIQFALERFHHQEVNRGVKDLKILESELKGQSLVSAEALANAPTVKSSIRWPFAGEAWWDEVGHYSVAIQSACSGPTTKAGDPL